MPTTTIRKNALKTIKSLIAQCELVTCYKYDDMESTPNKGAVSVDEIIEQGQSRGFDRVYKELDEAGNLVKVVVSIHGNHFYTGYHTKADAKQCMTPQAFANYFPEDAAAEREAEENARQEAYQVRQKTIDAATATLVITGNTDAFYIGERIVGTFATRNKNGTVAEYVIECEKPQNGQKVWERTGWRTLKNWQRKTCEVSKIVQLSTADYDDFAVNLMATLPAAFAGFSGGTNSDYSPGREINSVRDLSDEELGHWIAHSYEVVAIVSAPGRKSLIVSPQGYDYARYLGLSPQHIHDAGK